MKTFLVLILGCVFLPVFGGAQVAVYNLYPPAASSGTVTMTQLYDPNRPSPSSTDVASPNGWLTLTPAIINAATASGLALETTRATNAEGLLASTASLTTETNRALAAEALKINTSAIGVTVQGYNANTTTLGNSFGTAAGTFAQGNDSRLMLASTALQPSAIGTTVLAYSAVIPSAWIGTTSTTALAGNTSYASPASVTTAVATETTRAQAAETALTSPSRLATTGNAPALTMLTAAGSGSTATITGTNLAGTITMNSGVSLLSTGGVMTLTFADGFYFPNGCAIVFSPANANFASVYTKLYATPVVSGGHCTGVTINTALALSISTQYSGVYVIIGW